MTTNGLAAVLSSFKQLSDQDKAAAVQYITRDFSQKHQEGLLSHPHTSGPSEVEAHSCIHCRKLTVVRSKAAKRKNLAEYRWSRDAIVPSDYFFGEYQYSKDQLISGYHDGCLLVQWAFQLLARALMKLKNDVTDKNIPISRARGKHSVGHVTDDLEYLSEQSGITISLQKVWQGCQLSISHELEPFLLDRLFEASRHLDQHSGYKDFVYKYTRSASAEGLRIFTTEDNSASASIQQRPVSTAVDSEHSFASGRRWIDECYQNHDDCPKGTRILPSRVIEIGNSLPIRSVRLHWSEEGQSDKYAALSYCWGGQQPIQTTTSTAQDYTDGIRFSRFPKTLQDAMVTTLRLGIRYIWIDCLCIIQDDAEDVVREISKMAQIFQEAFVTISASCARNVDDGFLYPRAPPSNSRIKLAFEELDGTTGSVFIEQPRQYTPENDPISLRAWTLQERILSPRILDYSSEQLWWICKTCVLRDGDDERPGDQNDDYVLASTNAIRAGELSLTSWRATVRDYTRRFLTYPSDKLPAISGVAAEYHKVFHGAYLAGLWQFAFLAELMWNSSRGDISRPALQRAPSWSWASVDGEVNHKWCDGAVHASLRVLHCRVVPVSTLSPYGSVDPGLSILKMEGDMQKLLWREDRSFLADPLTWQDVAMAQADAREQIPIDKRGRMAVWALNVMTNPTRGLLLVHINGDTFKRVGIFFRYWGESEKFEKRVFTLV